jgi:CheY-like chemotaxis protein/HPt (histidine-containing phosphotransfer) domain-containing protein
MKNNKILIADDNALNRRVFQNIIGQVYSCEIAENGREVIQKLKSETYDLILLDIQMPNLDGINTLKIIKEENLTSAPIVAVSAFAESNDREFFLSAGFNDFVSKPIKPKLLLETIQGLLKSEESNDSITSGQWKRSNNVILDKGVLIKLLKFNTMENIKMVYNDFIEETSKLLKDIEYLIKYGDYQEIGGKLHIIKGNSGTLGAMEIYTFTQEYEKDIKLGIYTNALKDYIYLKTLFENFKNHCQSSEYLNP